MSESSGVAKQRDGFLRRRFLEILNPVYGQPFFDFPIFFFLATESSGFNEIAVYGGSPDMPKYMMGWVEIGHHENEAPMARATERMFLSGSLLKYVAVKLSSPGISATSLTSGAPVNSIATKLLGPPIHRARSVPSGVRVILGRPRPG